MKKNKALSVLVISLLSFSLLATAAQDAGETVDRRGVVADDYYAAGGTVTVDANVRGDVVAAGGTVSVGNNITEDVLLAGGTITVRGRVQDDARVAGGTITIDASIGDDLAAAGGEIEITRGSRIGGNAFVAGGTIELDGVVDGNLYVGAGQVELTGVVRGDVEIEADQIEIKEGGRIEGNLIYRSPRKAEIGEEAVISGEITYTETKRYQPHKGFRFISVITLSVAGITLLLMFPNFTQAASARVSSGFWKNLGLGFALLVATPVAAVIMMSLVVGVWVGLPVLALYFVALLTAYLLGAFYLASYGSQLTSFDISTRGRQVVALIVAVLVLTLLQFVPVLGGLVVFLLMVTALGAGTLQLFEVYHGGKNVVTSSKKKVSKKKKSSRR